MRLHVWLGGALLVAGGAGEARAADWEALPFGTFGGHYETNLGLSPVKANENTVSGLAGTAGIAFRGTTPLSVFEMRPRVDATYFPSDKDSDYINGMFDLEYRRTGQRSTFVLRGEAAHEIVTSAALPPTRPEGDLGNPLNGDIGGVGTRSRRDTLAVYPTLAVRFSDRHGMEFSGNFTDVSYDLKLPGEEQDYRFASIGGAWLFNVRPRDTLNFRLTVDDFNPQTVAGAFPSIGSNTYAATLRWTRQASQNHQWYVAGGGTRTKFEEVTGTTPLESKSGWTGGFGTNWQMQKALLFFDAVYRVQPSSSGAVSDQTDLRLQVVRNFTPRWNGTLGARYVRSEAVNPAAPTDYRDYGVLDLTAEWRWTRFVALRGQLSYVRQKLENQGAGGSKVVKLMIAYDSARKN